MTEIPDNSTFCFAIKVKSTENKYDTDWQQQNIKISFSYCEPIFTSASERIDLKYSINTERLNFTIHSQDSSGCSKTYFNITNNDENKTAIDFDFLTMQMDTNTNKTLNMSVYTADRNAVGMK